MQKIYCINGMPVLDCAILLYCSQRTKTHFSFVICQRLASEDPFTYRDIMLAASALNHVIPNEKTSLIIMIERYKKKAKE